MEKMNTEFKRGSPESEEHLGERIKRPVYTLTFGEYDGGRYEGEW